MPLSLQPPLVRSDRRRCVLATIEDARRQLKDWAADEDVVLDLIETGALQFAWDIALASERRAWRILPECIDHFDRTDGSRPFPLTEAKAYARVLEGCGDLLTVREISNLLNCGPTHVANLIAAKQFSVGRVTPCAPGATTIPRAAFLSFLKSRLEGAS